MEERFGSLCHFDICSTSPQLTDLSILSDKPGTYTIITLGGFEKRESRFMWFVTSRTTAENFLGRQGSWHARWSISQHIAAGGTRHARIGSELLEAFRRKSFERLPLLARCWEEKRWLEVGHFWGTCKTWFCRPITCIGCIHVHIESMSLRHC